MRTMMLVVFLVVASVTLTGCGAKSASISNQDIDSVGTPPAPPSIGANASTAP